MIDVNELNEWIKSEEGAAWADGLKAPLLAKRDELLESLRQSNAKAAEASRARADSEKLLSEERAAIEKALVEGELSRILKGARVVEPAIPGVIAELREAYGLTLKANGLERKAVGKGKDAAGKEIELDLAGVVKAWGATDAAKAVILSGSSGVGVVGPGESASGGYSRETIAAMSPREVAAKLDDPAFRGALEKLNTGA